MLLGRNVSAKALRAALFTKRIRLNTCDTIGFYERKSHCTVTRLGVQKVPAMGDPFAETAPWNVILAKPDDPQRSTYIIQHTA